MTRHEEIRRSYKELGGMANIYDGIITRSTLLGKLMDGLIWGLDGELSARWIEDALAPIPSGFSGRLLEVPVGHSDRGSRFRGPLHGDPFRVFPRR